MEISSGDILAFLYILIGVMLVVVLYHVLFIVVDMRKIMRRVEGITQQVEEVILKPISIADQIFVWIKEQLDKRSQHKDSHPHHKDLKN